MIRPTVKATVCLPTYDERENLEPMVLALGDQGVHVLVVDDNSPDGTGALADRLASELDYVDVIHRPAKQGLGPAYLAGFARALEGEAEFVFEMDADFSHDPNALPSLLARAGSADVAVGSRYVPGGGVEGWSKGRHALSLGGNIYARLALGFKVKDATSGFRCYRRRVLEAIELDTVRSNGYGFQVDMTYRAWQRGFRISEVPITFREREAGVSKMSRAIVAEAFVAVARWGLRDLLRGRRRPDPGAGSSSGSG